jgi:hypothetical protein
MDQREALSFKWMNAAVEESADALTYTFTPTERLPHYGVPLGIVVIFAGLPLGLLGLVVYALVVTNANRPEWELALTVTFILQTLTWIAVIGSTFLGAFYHSWFRFPTVMRFTHTHLWYASKRVCEVEEVRGLRLFTYPASDATKIEGCLSLVIGEEVPSAKPEGFGGTHGMFNGFDPQDLRALAEDIHRRLTAFLHNQGMTARIEPLSVIETTEDDANAKIHTRPVARSLGGLISGMSVSILHNPWVGSVWCLLLLAGLYASAQLILAVFHFAFLIGHVVLAFMTFALLMYHLNYKRPSKKADPTEA